MHNNNTHDRSILYPDELAGVLPGLFLSRRKESPQPHSHYDKPWGVPQMVVSGSPCSKKIREQMEKQESSRRPVQFSETSSPPLSCCQQGENTSLTYKSRLREKNTFLCQRQSSPRTSSAQDGAEISHTRRSPRTC